MNMSIEHTKPIVFEMNFKYSEARVLNNLHINLCIHASL